MLKNIALLFFLGFLTEINPLQAMELVGSPHKKQKIEEGKGCGNNYHIQQEEDVQDQKTLKYLTTQFIVNNLEHFSENSIKDLPAELKSDIEKLADRVNNFNQLWKKTKQLYSTAHEYQHTLANRILLAVAASPTEYPPNAIIEIFENNELQLRLHTHSFFGLLGQIASHKGVAAVKKLGQLSQQMSQYSDIIQHNIRMAQNAFLFDAIKYGGHSSNTGMHYSKDRYTCSTIRGNGS